MVLPHHLVRVAQVEKAFGQTLLELPFNEQVVVAAVNTTAQGPLVVRAVEDQTEETEPLF